MSAPTDTNQSATLSWAADEAASVSTVDELNERLDALDRQARDGDPFAVTLERPDGRVLSLTVGRDRSVVNYMASADPPYFASHDPSPASTARSSCGLFTRCCQMSPAASWKRWSFERISDRSQMRPRNAVSSSRPAHGICSTVRKSMMSRPVTSEMLLRRTADMQPL
jgi:hypothetical protein